MTKVKRITSFLSGLIIILFSILLFLDPRGSYSIIILVLALTLFIRGIRLFVYYFSMARHMVGGRTILYQAVIVLDIGIFTLSLTNVPLIYFILYLVMIHGISGVIDMLRALEVKRNESQSWKLNFCSGIINVLMAALCLVFIKSVLTAVMIYAAGLFYSGLIRIIQSFRKTAIVYIQ